MKINARQLSFLLNSKSGSTTVKNANIMICKALYGNNVEQIKVEIKINKNCSVDVDILEKSTGIPVRMAMEDLKKNALKRSSFAKYLMRDCVEKQLNTDRPKKIIRLPPVLRTLLSAETLHEVERYWNMHYAEKPMASWNSSVDYFPVLKP